MIPLYHGNKETISKSRKLKNNLKDKRKKEDPAEIVMFQAHPLSAEE